MIKIKDTDTIQDITEAINRTTLVDELLEKQNKLTHDALKPIIEKNSLEDQKDVLKIKDGDTINDIAVLIDNSDDSLVKHKKKIKSNSKADTDKFSELDGLLTEFINHSEQPVASEKDAAFITDKVLPDTFDVVPDISLEEDVKAHYEIKPVNDDPTSIVYANRRKPEESIYPNLTADEASFLLENRDIVNNLRDRLKNETTVAEIVANIFQADDLKIASITKNKERKAGERLAKEVAAFRLESNQMQLVITLTETDVFYTSKTDNVQNRFHYLVLHSNNEFVGLYDLLLTGSTSSYDGKFDEMTNRLQEIYLPNDKISLYSYYNSTN